MGARQRAGAAVAAAFAGLVLVAGPAQAAQASGPDAPANPEQAAPADPCAIPPGGEAPLMCQSGEVVPDEAEPAPTPTPDDRTDLLGPLTAAAVAAGAGAVVLVWHRRRTA